MIKYLYYHRDCGEKYWMQLVEDLRIYNPVDNPSIGLSRTDLCTCGSCKLGELAEVDLELYTPKQLAEVSYLIYHIETVAGELLEVLGNVSLLEAVDKTILHSKRKCAIVTLYVPVEDGAFPGLRELLWVSGLDADGTYT